MGKHRGDSECHAFSNEIKMGLSLHMSRCIEISSLSNWRVTFQDVDISIKMNGTYDTYI